MAQVFVCCEGVRDAGVFEALIEKCSSASARCMTHNDVKHIKIGNQKSLKRDKDKDDKVDMKAYIRRIAHIAGENDSTFIGYHQDAGGDFDRVYNSVNGAMDEYREKGYQCLAIVPKEMTESWLLADEYAYVAAYGNKPENPALPKRPEDIWGEKKMPESDYPKHVIERVLNQYRKAANRETYREIAENSDIDTIKNCCPKSFTRFVDDLANMGI